MARLTPDAADQRYLRRLFLTLTAIAAAALLYKALDYLLLAFGAMLGAVLLCAVADGIAGRTGWRRGIGLALATALLLGALGLIGWLFTTELGGQIGALEKRLPADWAAMQQRLSGDALGRMLLGALAQIGHSTRAATVAAGFGLGAGEILVNMIIVLIGAVFFAAQPALYTHGIVLLSPPTWRGPFAAALRDVGRALRLWLLTQLVSMVMMGVMIGIGLWWAGVPAAPALGLLGGLSEFIPYVGPTIAMIPPLVIALAGSGSVAGVLITYAVVRLVQANIITPLISQRVVSVPPALYLVLILASGAAFGTFGLFFSGALSVTIFTLVGRLYLRETLGEAIDLPGED